MTLSQIEEIVLKENDVNKLYQVRIEITKNKSRLQTLYNQNKNSELAKPSLGEMALYDDFKDIVMMRTADIRAWQERDANESIQYNKRFRLAAKKKLNPLTYNGIAEEANNFSNLVTHD